jgi:L-aminopeptidase/D-esterase-like protein
MKGLTDIPGILVGHSSDYDGLTGCTVVLCEQGAVAGGDIRGSATGVDGVVVATNAVLTKIEATKLAQLGQLGMARTINAVNTMSDGDLVIAMSAAPPGGTVHAPAVAKAIMRAVRLSRSLGGLPGLMK